MQYFIISSHDLASPTTHLRARTTAFSLDGTLRSPRHLAHAISWLHNFLKPRLRGVPRCLGVFGVVGVRGACGATANLADGVIGSDMRVHIKIDHTVRKWDIASRHV